MATTFFVVGLVAIVAVVVIVVAVYVALFGWDGKL